MFRVHLTPAAKRHLETVLEKMDHPRPGAMVMRQGPKADVVRSPNGSASWSVERPHPWAIQLGSFETYPDNELMLVDGIRFYLALIPRDNESGVTVDVRDGELFVEPISV